MSNEEIELHFTRMDDKTRNRIDLFLCEEAIKVFERNKNFRTFTLWCDRLSLEITSTVNSKSTKGWVSKDVIEIQAELIERLIEIFGFTPNEGYYVVKYFFMKKMYTEFESVARDTCMLFYKSIDKSFRRL